MKIALLALLAALLAGADAWDRLATASRLQKGKILFQSEGAEIFYRRIELTPLRSIQ